MQTIPLHSSRRMRSAKVTLSPGEEVGEHVTENREEIILVLKGEGTLINGKASIPLKEGQAHHIRENILHNVKNTSDREMEYVYVVSYNR